MIERRKKPRKDWVVGEDDVGQAVLKWTVDYRVTKRREADPLARTYDFLERLDAPDLEIAEDPAPRSAARGRNPYDNGPRRK
jgi:hypothetical protein